MRSIDNATRRAILEQAKAEGYEGSIVDLLRGGMPSAPLVASTPQAQAEGLRPQHRAGNTDASMLFPDVEPNQSFNTVGMQVPIDINKFDKQGHLIESYQNIPPGIEDLPTGPNEGMVLETPSQYQTGGFKLNRLDEMDFQDWYSRYSRATGNSPDPDDPQHHYDYRAFWKSTGGPPVYEGMHLDSRFKGLGHPDLYIEGKDTRKFQTGGFDYYGPRVFPYGPRKELDLQRPMKYQEGGFKNVISPKGDPWEYAREGNDFYTKKKDNDKWIKAEGTPRKAIMEKIFQVSESGLQRKQVSKSDTVEADIEKSATKTYTPRRGGRPLIGTGAPDEKPSAPPAPPPPLDIGPFYMPSHKAEADKTYVDTRFREDVLNLKQGNPPGLIETLFRRVKDAPSQAMYYMEKQGWMKPTIANKEDAPEQDFEANRRYKEEPQEKRHSGQEKKNFRIAPEQHRLDNDRDYKRPEVEFWGYRYQNHNDEGMVYVPGAREEKAPSKVSGVKGVAHFLIDSDLTDGRTVPATEQAIRHSKSENKYVPFFKEIKPGMVNVRYGKGKSEYSDLESKGYKTFANLRQIPLSEIDWDSSARPYHSHRVAENDNYARKDTKNMFGPRILNILTKDGKDTWLIYKQDNGKGGKMGRFNGNSLVFIIETPNGRVLRDFAGTIEDIENEASYIKKEFGVDEGKITLGFYDAGSYSAKPVADKNGNIHLSQWSLFNTDNTSGANLMIPADPW